ncbi:sigma 54-interacting transcriptional regulator [Haliangium ochraceum]|uniref:Putative sigma54 specific transcriptional regulator n=1 Tax=Haliangium ochraceum (strain DSM 14365 / JCM 11303 / SMP-2) TaxID=502025 RepID=D0LT39_HALO1|nr:sigma 54-interacting transcriptional regulator [Haliangium ochraceum]ACY19175.1 putative sigma54 specific transcriptional regulator [Haliangium ochraceum DSM 14365]
MADDTRDPVDGRTSLIGAHEVEADSVRGFELDVVEGADSGNHWESLTERCTIGAHPSCDLVLEDPTVSRFHCEILIGDRGASVRDLGSSNGTIIDGVRVSEGFLKRGSLLRLGRTMMRFQYMGRRNRIALSDRQDFGILVGKAVVMRAMFAVLERAAKTDITILLEGETGTGKSAAARSLHMESPRKDGSFVMIDCGSIPGNLLESELFGHVKGAFTGADAERVGAFEEASGGTIFLDEIGELPLELQTKLLSVLENRHIRRVGANAQRPIDVRVIAATNRDLRAEVNAGRFREDLYYRIAVVQIKLPPLRQRLDDLPALAEMLLKRMGIDEQRTREIITPEFVANLRSAAWPGNIRELRNYLEQYLVFDDVMITNAGAAPLEGASSLDIDATIPFSEARQQMLNNFERLYVSELLRLHDGKVSQAAAEAGIDRTYLYRLLRRHKIKS